MVDHLDFENLDGLQENVTHHHGNQTSAPASFIPIPRYSLGNAYLSSPPGFLEAVLLGAAERVNVYWLGLVDGGVKYCSVSRMFKVGLTNVLIGMGCLMRSS